MLQWLPWQDAAGAAVVTGGAWQAARRATSRLAVRLRPWTKEITLVLVLYGMWQCAGALSLGHVDRARRRGEWIWRVERALHLPSERAWQLAVLPHRLLVHWLNEFYVEAHVPALGLLLVWLFVRHRGHYAPVRTVVALVTAASLAIQLFPVAPPRLLPHLGVVDTGALIGPSDYAGGAPGVDQLSAMPSVHVGWALIVGVAVVWVSRRRWRWVALAYPLLTTFTVVVTGNHYWADGVVVSVLAVLAAVCARWAYRTQAAEDSAGTAATGRPTSSGSVTDVADIDPSRLIGATTDG